MKIKFTFLIFTILVFSTNAQIYTPSSIIQGTSGNNNVGIGTALPEHKLSIEGNHHEARVLLHSIGNGYDTGHADLVLWASEPGLTYTGTGIGNNIHNFNNVNGGLRLLNPVKGGSYLRLLDNSLSLNVVSSSGLDRLALNVNSEGNISVGINNVGVQTKFHVKENGSSNNIWRGRIVSSGDLNAVVMGENNGKASLGAHNSSLTEWSDLIIQSDGGNVGIGTTTPDSKLAVKGTIHSQEVKVDMNGWSDFVFKKDYKLPTVEEVEKHIKENGHLVNIPNEEEVLKSGINLGEMNAKLLQKIEELTLYIIELKKENIELEKRISNIENK